MFYQNNGTIDPTIIMQMAGQEVPFIPKSLSDANLNWSTPTGTPNVGNPTALQAASAVAMYPIVATEVANNSEMGTTLGVAYDRIHNQLFNSSYFRAFSPYQTNSSANGVAEAVIYSTTIDGGTPNSRYLAGFRNIVWR
ncbi:MAG: hypothetical protein R2795_13840 [Saprospiraceae bacterium]